MSGRVFRGWTRLSKGKCVLHSDVSEARTRASSVSSQALSHWAIDTDWLFEWESMDPDQLVSTDASWSGSTLFSKEYSFSKSFYVKYGKSLKLTHKLIHKAMLQNKTAHMTKPSDTKRHLILYTKFKIWMQ